MECYPTFGEYSVITLALSSACLQNRLLDDWPRYAPGPLRPDPGLSVREERFTLSERCHGTSSPVNISESSCEETLGKSSPLTAPFIGADLCGG